MTYLLLALLSAILYLLPFLFPYTFFWTVCFAIFPLYVLIDFYHKKRITSKQFLMSGFLWCSVVFGLHLSWFWLLLWSHGGVYKIVFGLCVLFYFSLIMMIPFFISFLLKKQKLASLFFFTLAFAGGVFFISCRSFFIFGSRDGYFLFNPLLSFMTLINKKKDIHNDNILIADLDSPKGSAIKRAHHISTCIARMVYKKKESCLVVFPEAAFPYNLEEHQEFLHAWCDCHDDLHLIVGAHKQEGEKTFNCAYYIHNAEIKQVYKKQHLVPFFEFIPEYLRENKLGEVFTKKQKTFSLPEQNNSDIFLINGKKYQLFICSELYQSAKPIKNMPILFIANSYWFTMKYAKILVGLQADYLSWWNKCEVVSAVSFNSI